VIVPAGPNNLWPVSDPEYAGDFNVIMAPSDSLVFVMPRRAALQVPSPSQNLQVIDISDEEEDDTIATLE
jgi:hypothetical protein